jgi:hypothetical protein
MKDKRLREIDHETFKDKMISRLKKIDPGVYPAMIKEIKAAARRQSDTGEKKTGRGRE